MTWRLCAAAVLMATAAMVGCSGPDAPKKKSNLKTEVPAPAIRVVA